MNDFAKATDVVRKGIEKDTDLYFAYQSNIAMQFYDEIKRLKEANSEVKINDEELHKAANNAAKAFLNLWIR